MVKVLDGMQMEEVLLVLSNLKGEKVMNKWNSLVVNDPDNDYNLVIELQYDEEFVGYIKKNGNTFDIAVYPNINKITIPLDWLENVINKAKKDL